MKVLFDTNVHRSVQRGIATPSSNNVISPAQVEAAKAKLTSGHTGFVAPLTLIELGSHVNDEEKEYYWQFRDAFRSVMTLCTAALPDPEAFLRSDVFGRPPHGDGLAPDETMMLCHLISGTELYDDLINPQNAFWKGGFVKITYNAGFLRDFREDAEIEYVQRMQDKVLAKVISNYAQRKAAGEQLIKLELGPLRDTVLDFLEGDELRQAFVDSQMWRSRTTPEEVVIDHEEVLAKVDAYYRAYVTILKEAIRDGYNVEKKKNDYNDLHFLIYLADPEVIFVTQDGKAVQKVPKGSPQRDRIFSFDEWLDRG